MRRSKDYDVMVERIKEIFLLHNGHDIGLHLSMYYGISAELNVAETLKSQSLVYDTIFGRVKIARDGKVDGNVEFNENTIKSIQSQLNRTDEMIAMMT